MEINQDRIRAAVENFVNSLFQLFMTATLAELAAMVVSRGLAGTARVEALAGGRRFRLELPDGRTWFSTRRRDLVRRARKLGFEVAGTA